MNEPHPDDQGQPPEIDFDGLYEQHYGLLVGIGVGRYRIPEPDAETLAHEVFVSFLLRAHRVVDYERWLVGAICNASRHHLRQSGRAAPFDAEAADAADPRSRHPGDLLPDQLAAREVFDCLTPVCRRALGLRYIEGDTVPEIAEALVSRYAQKRIARCLEQAQRRSKPRSGSPRGWSPGAGMKDEG